MVNKELLLNITSIPSPSGFEDKLIEYIYNYSTKNHKKMFPIMDSGELFLVRLCGNNLARTILYDAHIDQVSCRVLRITDDGYLIARCFGMDAKDVIGQEVNIITENGLITGVITTIPPHLSIKNKMVYIDIFAGDIKIAKSMVEVGDPIFFKTEPKIIRNHIVGSGLDNHIGVYCLLELANIIDNQSKIDCNLIIHLSRREEVGGLKFINMLDDDLEMPKRIDLVIVVDTDIANDIPSLNTLDQPETALGKGPILTRNLVDDHRVFKYLREICRQDKIPYQIAMSDGDGGNNLENYNQISSLGQFVGVPLRNMHSSIETVSLVDIDNTIDLLGSSYKNLNKLF